MFFTILQELQISIMNLASKVFRGSYQVSKKKKIILALYHYTYMLHEPMYVLTKHTICLVYILFYLILEQYCWRTGTTIFPLSYLKSDILHVEWFHKEIVFYTNQQNMATPLKQADVYSKIWNSNALLHKNQYRQFFFLRFVFCNFLMFLMNIKKNSKSFLNLKIK